MPQWRGAMMLPKPEGFNFVIWALVVAGTFVAFSRSRAVGRNVLLATILVVVGAVIWWLVSYLS
jgi:hypothetical protein